MKTKLNFKHIIPVTLANLPGVFFIYLFVTPFIKITTGRFVESVLKVSSLNPSSLLDATQTLSFISVICVIFIVAYWFWLEKDEDSIDKYLKLVFTNIFYISAVLLFLLLCYNFEEHSVVLVQNILISTLSWSLIVMTAKQLNNYDITKNNLLANVVILSPILISLLALINSYFH